METQKAPPENREYLTRSINVAVHLSIIALILYSSLKIISPFLMPVLWGIIIAVALHSVFEKMKAGLGGRGRLAGGIFIAVTLLLLIAPTVWPAGCP